MKRQVMPKLSKSKAFSIADTTSGIAELYVPSKDLSKNKHCIPTTKQSSLFFFETTANSKSIENGFKYEISNLQSHQIVMKTKQLMKEVLQVHTFLSFLSLSEKMNLQLQLPSEYHPRKALL